MRELGVCIWPRPPAWQQALPRPAGPQARGARGVRAPRRAERYVRPALRGAFLDLCRRPVRDYVGRFGFKSDLLQARWGGQERLGGVAGGEGGRGARRPGSRPPARAAGATGLPHGAQGAARRQKPKPKPKP